MSKKPSLSLSTGLSPVSGSPYVPSLASALSLIPSPSVSAPSTTPSLLASAIDALLPPVPCSFRSFMPSLSLSKSLKLNIPSPSVSIGPSVRSGSPNNASLLSALSLIPSPSASDPSTTPSPFASITPVGQPSDKSLMPSLSLSKSL